MFNAYTRLAQTYDLRTSLEWECDTSNFFKSWTPEQIERWNQERRESFAECAERYRLDTGNRVMVDLWDAGNCEPRPSRRKPKSDLARLARWNRVNHNWK